MLARKINADDEIMVGRLPETTRPKFWFRSQLLTHLIN